MQSPRTGLRAPFHSRPRLGRECPHRYLTKYPSIKSPWHLVIRSQNCQRSLLPLRLHSISLRHPQPPQSRLRRAHEIEKAAGQWFQPNPPKKRFKPPTLRISNGHTPLADISTDLPERSDKEEESSVDRSDDCDLEISQTPGSGSSVSQASQSLLNPPRARTSTIHGYFITRGDQFICKTCAKAYNTSGGPHGISRHLKKEHFIGSTVSALAEMRVKEEHL